MLFMTRRVVAFGRLMTEETVAIRKPAIWNTILILALIAAAAWLLSRRLTGPRVVSGTVEVDEAHVASRYGGRVEKINAQEGDTLTNG